MQGRGVEKNERRRKESSPLSCRPSSRVPCNRKGKLLRLAKERSKGEKGRSRGGSLIRSAARLGGFWGPRPWWVWSPDPAKDPRLNQLALTCCSLSIGKGGRKQLPSSSG